MASPALAMSSNYYQKCHIKNACSGSNAAVVSEEMQSVVLMKWRTRMQCKEWHLGNDKSKTGGDKIEVL